MAWCKAYYFNILNRLGVDHECDKTDGQAFS